VGAECPAQDAAMLGQRFRIPNGVQLAQELRRALHVGEEEGDGSGRKIRPHRRHDAPARRKPQGQKFVACPENTPATLSGADQS
jgi:hypothetical protein